MKPYANRGGNSNVESYEIGNDYIAVKFKGKNKIYVYSYSTAGAQNVDQAKKIAENGSGLNNYIMLNMKNNFER
jgi:hypothetical protein